MRNVVMMFGFVCLFVLLVVVVGHAAALAGMMAGETSPADFLLLTPLSLLLLVLNGVIYRGLKLRKVYAYLLGAIEMLALLVFSIAQILNFELVSLPPMMLLCAVAMAALNALWRDYQAAPSVHELS